MGRFTSVDPLADIAPEWRPFRYGFNNPVIYSDPDGMFESRGEAKKYKRKSEDQDIRRGSVKKNQDGTFSVRYGSNGSITKSNDGAILYATVSSRTSDHVSTSLTVAIAFPLAEKLIPTTLSGGSAIAGGVIAGAIATSYLAGPKQVG